jgi:hypothetical protein
MLNLEGFTGPAEPGPFTDHRLFASKQSHRATKSRFPMTSSSIRKRDNGKGEGEDDSDDDDEDDGNGSRVPSPPPPLPADAALVKAVAETPMAAAIEGWGPEERHPEVFKFFSVLVEPPPGLDLDKIEALPPYLMQLSDWLLKLPGNGVRHAAAHCWWIVFGMFCLFLYKPVLTRLQGFATINSSFASASNGSICFVVLRNLRSNSSTGVQRSGSRTMRDAHTQSRAPLSRG